MSLKNEFRKMIEGIISKFTIPPIENAFFPPFHKGGQPKDAQFMVLRLDGGATGISYVLLSDENMGAYTALQPADYIGIDPSVCALEFGRTDPVGEMVALAAINAVCQHVMKVTEFEVNSATDSLGLLSVSKGDRVGMVGLFPGLIKTIQNAGADLIVIEKNDRLIDKFSNLPITSDTSRLRTCNKVLSTSTTILNNTLDDILACCSPDAFISIVGPTAGYFPDPLFARGVDVVGGRIVIDYELFLQLLAERKRWGVATRRTCFQKNTYVSII